MDMAAKRAVALEEAEQYARKLDFILNRIIDS